MDTFLSPPSWKSRVRSIGKSVFRFQNLDFGFPIDREIRKRISTLTNLFLDFHFCRSIGKSEKGFEKLSLTKNSGLASVRIISKKKKKDRCSREQFCKSFFGFPNRKVNRKSMKSGFEFLKKKNPPWGRISRRWNPFLDFAFDWEIQISIWKSKSRFPNRTHP